jgi:uncharacterized repeat protein (TIGR04076 family)
MCPFLYYNLSPYVYTLSNDGWFSWTKKHQDTRYRKPIDTADFKKKDVNRRYPNEVLVRCPNPHSMVVAGVGPWSERMLKVRILNGNGLCSKFHTPDDEYLLDTHWSTSSSLEYSHVFPGMLLQHQTGTPLSMESVDCKKGIDATISVSRIVFPCRYHNRARDYKTDFHLPEGFCPHVFGAIYPQVLALMYNARIDSTIKIKHPGTNGDLILTVKKTYRVKHAMPRLILKIVQKVFETMFYPVDLLDYQLTMTVTERDIGGCSLEIGRKYSVNMNNENFLCPATFHALYPYLLLRTFGGNVRWDEHEAGSLVPCPDCVGSVYTIQCQGGAY